MKEQKNKMSDEQKALLLWKLAPGDANKLMRGEDPRPGKELIATPDSWDLKEKYDAHVEIVRMNVPVDDFAISLLRKGHVPEVQEDHWFMYFKDNVIRWYRSWTGLKVFEARLEKTTEGHVIKEVEVTLGIPEVPFSGPQSAGCLFLMLCSAEVGAAEGMWQYWHEYIDSLERGV